MRTCKAFIAALAALTLVVSTAPAAGLNTATVQAAAKKVSTAKYTISKKAGTYKDTVTVKVTAKKGYKVYYSLNGKLTTTKLIKSKKSKTLTIKKTKTLTVYAVKSSAKVTVKKLKSSAVKSAAKTYTYKITESSGTSAGGSPASDSSSSSENSSASDSSSSSEGSSASDSSSSSESSSASDSSPSDSSQTGTPSETTDSGITTVSLDQAQTYTLTGAHKNTVIAVNRAAAQIDDTITIVLDNYSIDNSSLTSDLPVISIGKNTADVRIKIKGVNSLTGSSSYTGAPASGIIYAEDSATTLTLTETSDGSSLTVSDAMPASTDFGSRDPSDGIAAKGTLSIGSGTYTIISNGDCLKGTGKKGKGGISVSGGSLTLTSNCGGGLKSKNGIINISGGTITTVKTAEDAINAKNYSVNISGGTVTIDNCYGDGIQGNYVDISGNSTVLSIKTCFANAGLNYYNTALGSGNYNTMTKTETQTSSTKTEVVNVDTGSHKAIKAGTKACTYVYTTVDDDSDYKAGETNTQVADGGLTISGGTITLDTTATGIKYNGSGMGGMIPMAVSNTISAANNDGQYILGSPDDGIHSNNTCVISGGNITIASADDGLTSAKSLAITGNASVSITTSYEGIESGAITIGEQGSASGPAVTVSSNDDGINASSKSSVNYVYADESEEQYTKTQVSASGNSLTVYSGSVTVSIADDTTHSYSLPTEDYGTVTGSYTSDGDGIDCNGSFYAYGGTVTVYGPSSNGNSPIDCDDSYTIGSGVTLLAVGSAGMIENPTSAGQAYIVSASGGMGGMNPFSLFADGFGGGPAGMGDMGNMGGMGSMSGMGSMGGMGGMGSATASTISSGATVSILDGSGNTLTSFTAPKALSYILYSAPSLASGSTYTVAADQTTVYTLTATK